MPPKRKSSTAPSGENGAQSTVDNVSSVHVSNHEKGSDILFDVPKLELNRAAAMFLINDNSYLTSVRMDNLSLDEAENMMKLAPNKIARIVKLHYKQSPIMRAGKKKGDGPNFLPWSSTYPEFGKTAYKAIEGAISYLPEKFQKDIFVDMANSLPDLGFISEITGFGRRKQDKIGLLGSGNSKGDGPTKKSKTGKKTVKKLVKKERKSLAKQIYEAEALRRSKPNKKVKKAKAKGRLKIRETQSGVSAGTELKMKARANREKIVNTEIIGSVVATQAGFQTIYTLPLNLGNGALHPSDTGKATTYEKQRYNKIKIKFCRNDALTLSGAIGMYIDVDPQDPPITSVQALVNHGLAAYGSISECHELTVHRGNWLMPWYNIVPATSVAGSSNANDRLAYCGVLRIVVDNPSQLNASLGILTFDFDCDVKDRRPPQTLALSLTNDEIKMTSTAKWPVTMTPPNDFATNSNNSTNLVAYDNAGVVTLSETLTGLTRQHVYHNPNYAVFTLEPGTYVVSMSGTRSGGGSGSVNMCFYECYASNYQSGSRAMTTSNVLGFSSDVGGTKVFSLVYTETVFCCIAADVAYTSGSLNFLAGNFSIYITKSILARSYENDFVKKFNQQTALFAYPGALQEALDFAAAHDTQSIAINYDTSEIKYDDHDEMHRNFLKVQRQLDDMREYLDLMRSEKEEKQSNKSFVAVEEKHFERRASSVPRPKLN